VSRIAIIGDGGWGTALAISAVRAGHDVSLWSAFPEYATQFAASRENIKFLPGITVPDEIAITADAGAALQGAELAVSAIPTQFVRGTISRISTALPANCTIASASKGLERGTLLRPSQILAEVAAGRGVAVLSGPSHAEEVARGLPASIVAAAESPKVAEQVQNLMMGPALRIYTSSDVVGVELGAALKNVIALAAGCADGLGLGDNAKAALITRGIVELARLGAALGAQAETFWGLSGLGDLVVTCASKHSRNRAVGERLGRGEKLAEILASTEKVAEGVPTTEAVLQLAAAKGVELPIAEAVGRVLSGGSPKEEVTKLMTRAPRPEA
jgi:glycerol-3-phosphate dehydrogenase (NAD(P)+)